MPTPIAAVETTVSPAAEDLLPRVARGEESAMNACIDRYSGLVWSIARRLARTTAEAEDAVQDAFVAIWKSADRYDRRKGSETAFLATIARRRIIDRIGRDRRQDRLADARAEQLLACEPTGPSTPAPPAASDEVRRALDAVNQLAPAQREVLLLAVHQGRTHVQIAEQTGMPLGTVKTHARRGLQRLRDLLADDDVTGGDA